MTVDVGAYKAERKLNDASMKAWTFQMQNIESMNECCMFYI